MSGYYNNSDLDDERQDSSGGGLRRQLEEALGEIKKLNDSLASRDREQSVSDLLRGKGIDPAVAEIIPTGSDPKEWVEKYAHLLGTRPESSQGEDGTAPEAQTPVEDDPALVAERDALDSIRGAAESGSPATVSSDVLERMDKITSEDELIKFFQTEGASGG